MEQQAQIKAEQVEQYKREMLAQARRTQMPAPPAAQAPVHIPAPAPAHEKVTAAGHVERLLERAEPVAQVVEPIAQAVLPPLAAAAAKGIELGVEALADHIEHKKAEHTPPPAPPPEPPAPPPAPAPPVIDIDFNQQIVQTAPAVVAPAVVAPAVAAPAVAAPVVAAPTVTAPAAAAVVAAPPPVQALAPPPPPPLPPPPHPPVKPIPLPVPVPPPPMPVPIPPIPVPVPVPRPQPPPSVSVLIPPVPVRPVPAPCETTTHTFTMTCPCRTVAKLAARPCPVHNPRPQSCCSSRKYAPVPCKPTPCANKGPRAPQASNWFAQPAVDAAYAAYTSSLAPDDGAVPAFRMPQAAQAFAPAAAFSSPADVAYAAQDTIEQDGYFELPVQDYASLEDYLARNTARGILELQVRVGSDNGAPVPGASVDILKTVAGVTYLFYHGVTDASGSAGRISLPAPDRNLSFAPPQGFVPYAVYTVSVTHGDYAPQVLENVTVFPDTESVQIVRMGMTATPSIVDEGRYVM